MFRALLICLVLLSCLVHAESLDLDALLKHAENVGLETLMRDAQQGDSEAQFVLGFMYYYGKDIPKDYSEAVRWYRKAAEQGYAGAQFMLGFMYYYGKGIPKDYSEAVHWYRKAAEQGYAGAQFVLGFMYYYGKGIPKDYSEAVHWYRKAADQGYAKTQFMLGNMYYLGKGIPKDYSEAVRWFRKAAEQGHAEAQFMLGNMYARGEGISENDAEAVHWYRKAAEQRYAPAHELLASAIAEGGYSPEVLDASVVCTDEDREYAASWNNSYDPEDAYKFGQTIKQLVADRDLTGLFELVPDELTVGPRKKFIENKTFDQVFSESWRSAILAGESPCSPVGWRGFMLANGLLWYGFNSYPPGTWYIKSIHGALEEKYMDAPSDPAWRVDGEVIRPGCFVREWMTGENYRAYQTTYGIEDPWDFDKYPGKYFGREINRIGPINSRHYNDVHLATVLDDCPPVDPDLVSSQLDIDKDDVSWLWCPEEGPDEGRCLSDSYRLLAPLSQAECQSLAPHLPGQCESAYLVKTVEQTGGTGMLAFEVNYNFYGLFNLEDGRKAIVPLANFWAENHARNFLDELRAGHSCVMCWLPW